MSALQAEMLELDYLTKLNHEGKSHLRTEEKKKKLHQNLSILTASLQQPRFMAL